MASHSLKYQYETILTINDAVSYRLTLNKIFVSISRLKSKCLQYNTGGL